MVNTKYEKGLSIRRALTCTGWRILIQHLDVGLALLTTLKKDHTKAENELFRQLGIDFSELQLKLNLDSFDGHLK